MPTEAQALKQALADLLDDLKAKNSRPEQFANAAHELGEFIDQLRDTRQAFVTAFSEARQKE